MKTKEIDLVLQAEKREIKTKGAVKALRRSGKVPGVVYGDKGGPMTLAVDEKTLQQIIHSERGRNALITLQVADTSHAVLVKEIQRHAITRAIVHVDFHRVSLKQKVEAAVPIHVKGEAPGVKLGGGVLEHLVREARVRCLPTEIPAALDADVSTLQIGQAIKAKDLKVPAGVELLLDGESIIINIVSPTILEEPTVAAATEATSAEPEVIKKGKVEEGEEGAAAASAAGAGAEKKPAPGGAAKAPAAGAPPAKPEAKKPEGK
jgi:large subunit ribosomal protein L25